MQETPEAKGVLRLFIRCMSLEMKTLAQHVPKNLSRFEKYLPGFRIMTVTREQQAYRVRTPYAGPPAKNILLTNTRMPWKSSIPHSRGSKP